MTRSLSADLAAPDLTGVDLPSEERLATARRKSRAAIVAELGYVGWLGLLFVLGVLGVEWMPEPTLTAVDIGLSLLRFIVFLVWVYEAYRVAGMLSRYPMDTTPGWAVGVFIIPIVNLWMPFQRMSEIEETSRPDDLSVYEDSAGLRPLLGLWWAVWILATIGGQIIERVPDGPYWLYLGAGGAVIGMSILSALVAYRIHEAQEAHADRLYAALDEADAGPDASDAGW